MNKERRKVLAGLIEDIENAKSSLETIRDEEQEYHDNMPENMQQGDKGEIADNNVQAMETAISELEDAMSHAQTALDELGAIE